MSTVIITLPSVPTVVTCLAAASTVHAWVALLSSMGTLGFMSFSIREKGSLYTRYHYISRSRSCCIFQSRVRNMHRTSKHITNGRLSTATIRSSVHNVSVHGPRNGPRLLSPTDGSKSKTPSAERDRSSSGTATVQGNHRSTFSDDRRRAPRTGDGPRTSMPGPPPLTTHKK